MKHAADSVRATLAAGLVRRNEARLLRRCELPNGIDLTSNDSLDLAACPDLAQKVAEGVASFGAGAGASRLLRGHSTLFEEAEKRLAAFSGQAASLIFSSGYAANVGLLSGLIGEGDRVVSDALNHASLIDGMRLSRGTRHIYPHQDLKALEAILAKPHSGQTFIVTESLFSMDGDLTDLASIVDLGDRYGAAVIVDEAHATGLYGARGSGRVEALGLTERVLCTVHTGGKALGVGGAWIAGSEELVGWLVNHARSFIYSTGTVPAIPIGLMAAVEIIQEQPDRVERLHHNAERLREALRAKSIAIGPSESHVIPVMIGDADKGLSIAAALKSEGFDIRAVRPPTVPDGTTRLRIAVRSALTSSELNQCVEALASVLTAHLGNDSK